MLLPLIHTSSRLTCAAALCVVTLVLVRAQDVRMPPQIVKGPLHELVFRTDHEIKLECTADGIPKPTTTWTKNGRPLEPRSNIVYDVDGIVIKELSFFDEGYYQCIAQNMHGTALSNTAFLQRAIIGTYTTTGINTVDHLQEGQPYMIQYSPVKCFPKPSFSWAIAKDTVEVSPETIVPDKRVQIDENGNLHFSYLLPGDARDGRLYKCNVLNPYLDLTVGGSYTKLVIQSKGGVTESPPVKAFSSDPTVIAVEGRNVTLRCFFSGYPDPSLTWSKKAGGSMPIGRYTITNYNTELTIRNVQQSDEGDYLCRGSNKVGMEDITIQIDVQAAPTFETPAHRPHAINITEGETVNLTCQARAEPLAHITWLKNGVALEDGNLPQRMRLANNGMTLLIDNVCKDCDDGMSDIQVIQCNASNVHGYNFTDAYINVLQKTLITDKPAPVHLEYDATTAMFHCAATSDDITPVTLTWHRVSDNRKMSNMTGRMTVTVSGDGRTLTLKLAPNATDEWSKWRSNYCCTASNTYSTDTAKALLTVDDPPTLPPLFDLTTTDPDAAAVVTAGLADYWWILVIIAIILLILIIIICCCFCCRKCKGDTYYVDKKEKRDHKDPEKELADSALQPYRRPDADPLKGSRASLGSSLKGDSDEEGSLNEYGDIDAGKFTEDGSFIGDYNTDTRKTAGRSGQSFA